MIKGFFQNTGIRLAVVFAAVILLLPLCRATAQDAKIDEIVVTNTNTSVLLFLTVNNAFTEEMVLGMHNGIPVKFIFSVELSRKNSGWFNQEVTFLEFNHTMNYDTLKEEYRIEQDERPGKLVRTKNFTEAKQLMTQLNGVTVAPLSTLLPDAEYSLRVKARQAEETLPLYFHYVIPFWGLWDFETDWYTIEFRY